MTVMTMQERFNAAGWLAMVVGQTEDKVLGLGLTDNQLLTLSWWLHDNPRVRMHEPPRTIPYKIARYHCSCGCGEWVERQYKTRRPRYKDNAHKQKAYMARRRKARRAALWT